MKVILLMAALCVIGSGMPAPYPQFFQQRPRPFLRPGGLLGLGILGPQQPHQHHRDQPQTAPVAPAVAPVAPAPVPAPVPAAVAPEASMS